MKIKEKPITKVSPMPFGKFKGIPIKDVPEDYLLYLIRECKNYGEFKKYLNRAYKKIKSKSERKYSNYKLMRMNHGHKTINY